MRILDATFQSKSFLLGNESMFARMPNLIISPRRELQINDNEFWLEGNMYTWNRADEGVLKISMMRWQKKHDLILTRP